MTIQRVSPDLLENLQAALRTRMDLRETGPLSPMLGLLHAADPARLAETTHERLYRPGEIIFREGQVGDSLYVIWAGYVVILKGSLDAPAVMGILDPGNVFGEMAILENQPRSATIVALSDLRLLEVNHLGFEQLVVSFPEIARSLMTVLSAKLRRMTEVSSTGEQTQKALSRQVSALEDEKQRLEDLQRLRQETSELIIHDLRNPLGAIAMAWRMLNMLLPPDVRQAQAEILSIGQANIDRMQRLIDTLLEVSRLETGEAELHREPLDLTGMVVDLARRQSILAQDEITFHLALPPSLPGLLADRDKIERVLANLVDNALKYSPHAGIVTIGALCRPGEVEISVTDQGPGIPEAERKRIFERFAQAPGSEQARRRGFGLGLTYCRLTVERHGGRIWVEPGENDRGSRFAFTLPV